MRIFDLSEDLPADARGAVLAIGNFDGVHLGHRGVIKETGAIAKRLGAPLAVMTFEPHPRRLFAPDAAPFRLASLEAKARALADLGVDQLIVCPFDRAFAAIPAADFINDILLARLGVQHVVVGDDFCFGHQRAGDIALLRARGADIGADASADGGFGVTPAPQVCDTDGQVISSNTIRTALGAGDMATARRLLGRPWELDGLVVHGDARGRELGFPTANIDMDDYLHPAKGVYAVRVGVPDGPGGEAISWWDGAASFGLRPQFEGKDLRLEVFLLDFSGDLYGRTLRVVFHAFLRGEQTFADTAGLIHQMEQDVAQTREILAESV
jgi:riboflavin kinase/FMN adenylyltransferase